MRLATYERDNQRSKVYAAERASGLCRAEQTIPNKELQEWVDNVLDSRFIRSRWGVRQVQVKLTGGRAGASAWGSHKITASPGARNEYVMLHEIAHTLAPSTEMHGPKFCGILLFLVKHVLGREAYLSLLGEMRAHRVKRSNAGIPKVRSDVPPQRKARERQARKKKHDDALMRIANNVAEGHVSWRQVIAFAKEQQKLEAAYKAAKK